MRLPLYPPKADTEALGAIKKASELISGGCWNVEIITPDGATYHPEEIEN